MKEQYTVDVNKLYAWYRIAVGLTKLATEAVMSDLDYTKPVEVLEKPSLGLSLVDQSGIKAVLPDYVLILVEGK